MAVRHLHRDYSTAHCGKDISHLLATFDEGEATCLSCKKGLEAFRAIEEAARVEEERLRAEKEAEHAEKIAAKKRRQDERQRKAEEAAEDRELARLKMERAMGLRK